MRFRTVAIVLAGWVAVVAPARAAALPSTAVAYDSFGPNYETQIFGVWMGPRPTFAEYQLVAHPFRVGTAGRLSSIVTSMYHYDGAINRVPMRIVRGTPGGLPDAADVVWSETFDNALASIYAAPRSTFLPTRPPTLEPGTTYWMFPEFPHESEWNYGWLMAAPATADDPGSYALYTEQPDGTSALRLEHPAYHLGLRLDVVVPEPTALLSVATALGSLCRRRGPRGVQLRLRRRWRSAGCGGNTD